MFDKSSKANRERLFKAMKGDPIALQSLVAITKSSPKSIKDSVNTIKGMVEQIAKDKNISFDEAFEYLNKNGFNK